jgi:hypothetical protein
MECLDIWSVAFIIEDPAHDLWREDSVTEGGEILTNRILDGFMQEEVQRAVQGGIIVKLVWHNRRGLEKASSRA